MRNGEKAPPDTYRMHEYDSPRTMVKDYALAYAVTGRVAEDEAAPVVGDADVRADDGYRRVDGRRAPDDGPASARA